MGILYKTPSGYVMQSPLLAVVNQCVDTITKLSREFGLTPAARSRMSVQPEEDHSFDDLMRILARRGVATFCRNQSRSDECAVARVRSHVDSHRHASVSKH